MKMMVAIEPRIEIVMNDDIVPMDLPAPFFEMASAVEARNDVGLFMPHTAVAEPVHKIRSSGGSRRGTPRPRRRCRPGWTGPGPGSRVA